MTRMVCAEMPRVFIRLLFVPAFAAIVSASVPSVAGTLIFEAPAEPIIHFESPKNSGANQPAKKSGAKIKSSTDTGGGLGKKRQPR